MENNKLVKLEEGSSPHLQIITGGKGGDGENWLYNLMPGTIFLARCKGSNPKDTFGIILNKYMVIEHKNKSSNLYLGLPEGKQLDIWVPTLEFSRNFTHMDTIGLFPLEMLKYAPEEEKPVTGEPVEQEKETETEQTNGNNSEQ